jgi:hypothetical protein
LKAKVEKELADDEAKFKAEKAAKAAAVEASKKKFAAEVAALKAQNDKVVYPGFSKGELWTANMPAPIQDGYS